MTLIKEWWMRFVTRTKPPSVASTDEPDIEAAQAETEEARRRVRALEARAGIARRGHRGGHHAH